MADDGKGSKINDTSQASRDDWHDLRGNADNEQLKANTLKTDPLVFALCAQACHDMVGKAQWYRDFIHSESMDNLKMFSDEEGGQELTRRFNQKATDVRERLDLLRWTMEDMGDTFIRACKQYLSADEVNKAGFDKIGDLQTVAPIGPNVPKPVNGDPPGHGEHPPVPEAPPGPDNGSPIHVTSADGWGIDRFHQFRLALEGSDHVANDAGEKYGWLAEKLRTDLLDLNTKLGNVKKEMWSGQGADRAMDAIKRFTEGSVNFTKALDYLSADLIYCSKWIFAMFNDTPGQAEAYTNECKKSDWLKGYRETYNAVYKPGIAGAVNVMPQVVMTATVSQPPPEDNKNGQGDGNGKGDGKGKDDAYYHDKRDQRADNYNFDRKARNQDGSNENRNESNGNANNSSNGGGNNQGSGTSGGNGNSGGGGNSGGSGNGGGIDKNSPNYKAGYQDASNQGPGDKPAGNSGNGSSGGSGSNGGGDGNGSGYSGSKARVPEPEYGGGSGPGNGSSNGSGSEGKGGSGSQSGSGGKEGGSGKESGSGKEGGGGSPSGGNPNPPGQQGPLGSPQELLNKLLRGENPLKNLSPEALRKVGADLLGGLSPELLKNMTPEGLQKLTSDLLQGLSPDQLKKLGSDILGGLTPEGLKNLGPDVLKNVDPEILRNLSPETMRALGQTMAQTPGGADLIKLLTDGINGFTKTIGDVVKSGTEMLAGLANTGALGIPGLGELQHTALPTDSPFARDLAAAVRSAGGGAGVPGGGGGAPHSQLTAQTAPFEASKLFPRAAMQHEVGAQQTQNQIAQPGSQSGMPMGPGPGPGGAQGAGAEYKRPKYLDSETHLDEGLGPDIKRVRPVIEP